MRHFVTGFLVGPPAYMQACMNTRAPCFRYTPRHSHACMLDLVVPTAFDIVDGHVCLTFLSDCGNEPKKR